MPPKRTTRQHYLETLLRRLEKEEEALKPDKLLEQCCDAALIQIKSIQITVARLVKKLLGHKALHETRQVIESQELELRQYLARLRRYRARLKKSTAVDDDDDDCVPGEVYIEGEEEDDGGGVPLRNGTGLYRRMEIKVHTFQANPPVTQQSVLLQEINRHTDEGSVLASALGIDAKAETRRPDSADAHEQRSAQLQEINIQRATTADNGRGHGSADAHDGSQSEEEALGIADEERHCPPTEKSTASSSEIDEHSKSLLATGALNHDQSSDDDKGQWQPFNFSCNPLRVNVPLCVFPSSAAPKANSSKVRETNGKTQLCIQPFAADFSPNPLIVQLSALLVLVPHRGAQRQLRAFHRTALPALTWALIGADPPAPHRALNIEQIETDVARSACSTEWIKISKDFLVESFQDHLLVTHRRGAFEKRRISTRHIGRQSPLLLRGNYLLAQNCVPKSTRCFYLWNIASGPNTPTKVDCESITGQDFEDLRDRQFRGLLMFPDGSLLLTVKGGGCTLRFGAEDSQAQFCTVQLPLASAAKVSIIGLEGGRFVLCGYSPATWYIMEFDMGKAHRMADQTSSPLTAEQLEACFSTLQKIDNGATIRSVCVYAPNWYLLRLDCPGQPASTAWLSGSQDGDLCLVPEQRWANEDFGTASFWDAPWTAPDGPIKKKRRSTERKYDADQPNIEMLRLTDDAISSAEGQLEVIRQLKRQTSASVLAKACFDGALRQLQACFASLDLLASNVLSDDHIRSNVVGSELQRCRVALEKDGEESDDDFVPQIAEFRLAQYPGRAPGVDAWEHPALALVVNVPRVLPLVDVTKREFRAPARVLALAELLRRQHGRPSAVPPALVWSVVAAFGPSPRFLSPDTHIASLSNPLTQHYRVTNADRPWGLSADWFVECPHSFLFAHPRSRTPYDTAASTNAATVESTVRVRLTGKGQHYVRDVDGDLVLTEYLAEFERFEYQRTKLFSVIDLRLRTESPLALPKSSSHQIILMSSARSVVFVRDRKIVQMRLDTDAKFEYPSDTTTSETRNLHPRDKIQEKFVSIARIDALRFVALSEQSTSQGRNVESRFHFLQCSADAPLRLVAIVPNNCLNVPLPAYGHLPQFHMAHYAPGWCLGQVTSANASLVQYFWLTLGSEETKVYPSDSMVRNDVSVVAKIQPLTESEVQCLLFSTQQAGSSSHAVAARLRDLVVLPCW